MRCYYRNDISCGANRREFEDQSVIKDKLDQIGIRPIRVSHFGDFFRVHFVKRERKRRRRRRERKPRKVWILVCSISRVYLGIHPNLRFVESWVGKTLVCIR